MRVLCTHPGKLGDILWALPTIRYISEQYGEKVDFMTSIAYEKVLDLVQFAPYVGRAFIALEWGVQDTAPMTPWMPPAWVTADYDHVYHLGYRDWPREVLYKEVARTAAIPTKVYDDPHFIRPWLKVEPIRCSELVAVGFTDEWFELKFGIHACLQLAGVMMVPLGAPGSRWTREGHLPGFDLTGAARIIAGSKLFLGCLSSLAVVACALGKKRILVEPNPMRHHSIFQHPDQNLLPGTDGKPTFDARHVVDAVREALKG